MFVTRPSIINTTDLSDVFDISTNVIEYRMYSMKFYSDTNNIAMLFIDKIQIHFE